MASSSRKHGRRSFLAGAAALGGAGLVPRPAGGFVPAHNWDRYDWGTAPLVRDRLNQGPFPQYPPEEVLPGSDVVMATTPSDDVVPGYGKGLVTYLTGDFAAATFEGLDVAATIEAFARIPLGQKLYLRPTWRDLQKRPGRLDPEEYWKVALAAARRHGKPLGFRVMMSDPDIAGPSLPDFVLEKVPMVPLEGEWKRSGAGGTGVRHTKRHEEPRYDHPFFHEAFRELVSLLAAELDGGPLVEYVDTCMYGFWDEGYTWPYRGHPFPDAATAEATFVRMFEVQLEHWKKTPLVTNTQPDWSRVGNSELVDRTVRSHNWLRTDTIFVENEQIEAISNRRPWVAAVLEVAAGPELPHAGPGQRVVHRGDEIAPPSRTVEEEVGAGEGESSRRKQDRGGHAMHEEEAGRRRRRREREARERQASPPAFGRPARRDDPVGDERHRAQDGGDEPPVEVRERHRRGGGEQERGAAEIRAVEAPPQGQEVEREPLRLSHVRVVGGVAHVEGEERIGQARHHRPQMRAEDVARQQVGVVVCRCRDRAACLGPPL